MNSVREKICSAKTFHSPRMSLLFQSYFFATVEELSREKAWSHSTERMAHHKEARREVGVGR